MSFVPISIVIVVFSLTIDESDSELHHLIRIQIDYLFFDIMMRPITTRENGIVVSMYIISRHTRFAISALVLVHLNRHKDPKNEYLLPVGVY